MSTFCCSFDLVKVGNFCCFILPPFPGTFDLTGKLVKATIPIRSAAQQLAAVPVRIVRLIFTPAGPTALRYHRLKPNYDVYWQYDSDAVNSIDVHEVMLGFTSRGDECLSCAPPNGSVKMPYDPLTIRVHKSGPHPEGVWMDP
jgi:hypothetical protein